MRLPRGVYPERRFFASLRMTVAKGSQRHAELPKYPQITIRKQKDIKKGGVNLC